jgi:hypothetical protein
MGGGSFDSRNALMRAPAFALGALGAILALTHLGLALQVGAACGGDACQPTVAGSTPD